MADDILNCSGKQQPWCKQCSEAKNLLLCATGAQYILGTDKENGIVMILLSL